MSRREAIGLTVFFLIAFGIPWAGWTVLEHLDLPYWLLPIFCSIAGFVASYAEGGADGLHRFCQRTLHVRGTAKFHFSGCVHSNDVGASISFRRQCTILASSTCTKAGFSYDSRHGTCHRPARRRIWVAWISSSQTSSLYAPPLGCPDSRCHLVCLAHPSFFSSVFSSTQSALGFLAFCVTWAIFLAYLVPRANGSVWPAVFLHWSVNTHPSILSAFFPAIDGSQLPGDSKTTLLYGVAAIAFILLHWRYFTKRAALQATSNNSFKPKPLRGSA